jgi:hypothetical protein
MIVIVAANEPSHDDRAFNAGILGNLPDRSLECS